LKRWLDNLSKHFNPYWWDSSHDSKIKHKGKIEFISLTIDGIVDDLRDESWACHVQEPSCWKEEVTH